MTIYRDAREDIREAYTLAQQIEKIITRSKKPKEEVLQQIFLATVGPEGRLAAIEKSSLQGRVLKMRHKKGAKTQTKWGALHAEANFQKASDLIKRVAGADDSLKEEIAREFKVSIESLNKTLSAFHDSIDSIRTHVIQKGTHTLVGLVAISTLVKKTEEEIKGELVGKKFEPAIAQSIAHFVNESSEKNQLLQEIFDTERSVEEITRFVSQALWRALLTAGDNKRDEYTKMIWKLVPSELEAGVSLQTIEHVFGDHFLGEVETTEEPSPSWYARLFVQSLDARSASHTEATGRLRTLVNGVIHLRTNADISTLKLTIEYQLNTVGSCLLMDSWKGGSVLYEIERQKNGTYTFRIYNRGKGFEYNPQYSPQYSVKRAPCIAVKDISKGKLLGAQFLGGLQGLGALDERGDVKPQELIVSYLLPVLRGKVEEMPPHVQAAVSPLRSKSSSYGCFDAFLARSLSQKQYRIAKFEFKLYLLSRFASSVRALADSPVDKETIGPLRKQYAVIQRSMEQFAASMDRAPQGLSHQSMRDAQQLVQVYSSALQKVDSKIVEYERAVAAKAIPEPSGMRCGPVGCPIERALPYSPQGGEIGVESTFLSLPGQELSLKISALGKENFNTGFEAILNELSTNCESIPKEELIRICDALFRKVPSVHSWSGITYTHPEDALDHLEAITSKLFEQIKGDAVPAERYLLCLYASYGLDCAYRQCSAIPVKGSFLDREMVEPLRALQSSDGFWVARSGELQKLCTGTSIFPESSNKIFALAEEILSALSKRWKESSQKAFQEAVAKSVASDRVAQLEEIKRRKAEEGGLLEETYQEIKRLLLSEGMSEKDITSQIDTLKRLTPHFDSAALHRGLSPESQSDELERLIDAAKNYFYRINTKRSKKNEEPCIEDEVYDDHKYWPEDWGVSDQFNMSFLYGYKDFVKEKLGELADTFFNEQFSIFCTNAIYARNVFKKFHAPFLLRVRPQNRNPPAVLLWYPKQVDDSHNRDRYGEALVRNPVLAAYYSPPQEVQPSAAPLKGLKETTVPSVVSEICRRKQNVPFDEMTQILAICTKPDGQIDSLVNYFIENRAKLSDTPWIHFFHHVLFDSDLLLQELEDPARREPLLDQLHALFTSSIENCIATDDLATAANLVWLAKSVERYASASQTAHRELVRNDLIVQLFRRAGSPKCIAQRPVIFEALLAACAPIFQETPIAKENEDLFACACFVRLLSKKSAPPKKESCGPRQEEAVQAAFLLQQRISDGTDAEHIAQILVRPDSLQLLSALYPSLQHRSLVCVGGTQCDVYHIMDGGKPCGSISLSSGAIVAPGVLEEYDLGVSEWVVEVLKRARISIENVDFSSLKSVSTGNGCTIEWSNGASIHIQGDTIHIKTKYLDKWAQCINTFLQYSSTELYERYICLHDGTTAYLCDSTTFEPKFEVDGDGKIRIWKRSPDLHVAELPEVFGQFENGQRAVCLANEEGVPQKVEFPRLGLSIENKGDQWVLSQQEEWHLVTDQFVPHLGDEVGHLVFEHSKTQERKVLLPVWEPFKFKHSLSPQYQYAFEASKKGGTCVEFVLKENRLIPQEVLARYYLARIYIEKENLDRAWELLCSTEAFETKQKLSPDARRMLEQIACVNVSGDIRARTTRLRMQALLILQRNDSQFPYAEEAESFDFEAEEIKAKSSQEDAQAVQKHKNEIKEATEKLVTSYLEKLSGIKQPLEEHDELFLLQRLNKEMEITSPSIERRIQQLMVCDPFSADTIPPSVERTAPQALQRFLTSIVGMFQEPEAITRVNPVPLGTKREVMKEFWCRTQYRVCRLFNTLPFDPLTIGWDEFKYYHKALTNEVKRSKRWGAGVRSGLVQALNYMAYFSSDWDVRRSCRELLTAYTTRVGDTRVQSTKRYLAKGKALSLAERKAQKFKPILSEVAALDCLKASEGDKETFVQGQATQYFERNPIPKAAEVGKPILSADSPEVTDTTTERKFRTTAEDIAIAEKRQEERILLKDGKTLDMLVETIDIRLKDEKQKLTTMESDITTAVAAGLTADPASLAQFESRKRQLPNINELCACCSKVNAGAYLHERFPELTEAGIHRLETCMAQYLWQVQHVQQLERTLQKAKDALLVHSKKNPDAYAAVIGDLYRTMSAKREYAADDEYAGIYRFLETVMNIKLRKEQVDNIKKLIVGIKENHPVVLQMIMGGGKTSVIQPILSFLLADGNFLSVVDVPAAQRPTVRALLAKTLGSAFQQLVYEVDFTRKRAKDIGYLKMYLDTLRDIQRKKACYIRSPRIKQSILASLSESLATLNEKGGDTPENRARYAIIGEINLLTQGGEVVQIDEIHLAMDPKVEFKHPLGSSEPIDAERTTILTELVFDIATDEQLHENVSLDFAEAFLHKVDPSQQRKAKEITEETFKTIVQPRAADLAIARLDRDIGGLKKSADEDQNKYLWHFLKESSPFDDDIARERGGHEAEFDDLRQELGTFSSEQLTACIGSSDSLKKLVAQRYLFLKEADRWIREKVPDASQRAKIGVCVKAIRHILKESLLKKCKDTYAKDPRPSQRIARPYYAPKSPKPTMFADPYKQVIYTAQMALSEGIPRDAALAKYKKLQKNARLEMKQGMLLTDTNAYKKFASIMGETVLELLDPITEHSLDRFQANLSKNRELLLEYFKEYVFKQVKRYRKSVSCTPQTLAGSSKTTFGYTGTLHAGILAPQMDALPEPGTEGRTILAIEEKMRGDLVSTRVFDKGPLPQQVITSFVKNPSLCVFIDSGAWLLNEEVKPFAQRMLESVEGVRNNVKGVVYHNEKGDIVSLERRGSELVEVPIAHSAYRTDDGSLLTIIAKKYETGTDIAQPPSAQALMSVRRQMIKQDNLQSASRMRKILLQQGVHFGVSEEVRDDIVARIWKGVVRKGGATLLEGDLPSLHLPDNVYAALIEARKQAAGDLTQMPALFAKKLDLNSRDIWRYLTANEAKDEQEKNWIAGIHRMREVIELPIRTVFEAPLSQKESERQKQITARKDLFKEVESLFVENTIDDPYEEVAGGTRYEKAESAMYAQIRLHMRYIKKLRELEASNPAAKMALDEMAKLYPPVAFTPTAANIEKLAGLGELEGAIFARLRGCVELRDVATIIEMKSSGDQSDTELEVEQEQEVEQEEEEEAEQEVEVEVETEQVEGSLDEKPYTPLVRDVNEFFSKSFTKVHGLVSSKLTTDLTPMEKITYSPNLFPDDKLSSFYNLPGMYILAIIDRTKQPSETKYLLLSHQDYAEIRKSVASFKKKDKELILLTYHGDVMGPKAPFEALDTTVKGEIEEVRILAKLHTGVPISSTQELEKLRQMIDGVGGTKETQRETVSQLRRIFEQAVHKKETASLEYEGGLLQNFFYKYGLTGDLSEAKAKGPKPVKRVDVFDAMARRGLDPNKCNIFDPAIVARAAGRISMVKSLFGVYSALLRMDLAALCRPKGKYEEPQVAVELVTLQAAMERAFDYSSEVKAYQWMGWWLETAKKCNISPMLGLEYPENVAKILLDARQWLSENWSRQHKVS